jgi:hypothetical protein
MESNDEIEVDLISNSTMNPTKMPEMKDSNHFKVIVSDL